MTVSYADFVPFFLGPLMAWGVRRALRRKGDWDRLKKWTLGIGIFAYMVTELARSFYRPYIYANGIHDFHIADTIGNSAGTVTAIFMILTLSKAGRAKANQLILMVFCGLIAYEVLSATSGHRIDVWDLAATVLFSGLSWWAHHGILVPRFGKKPPSEETPEKLGSSAG